MRVVIGAQQYSAGRTPERLASWCLVGLLRKWHLTPTSPPTALNYVASVST